MACQRAGAKAQAACSVPSLATACCSLKSAFPPAPSYSTRPHRRSAESQPLCVPPRRPPKPHLSLLTPQAGLTCPPSSPRSTVRRVLAPRGMPEAQASSCVPALAHTALAPGGLAFLPPPLHPGLGGCFQKLPRKLTSPEGTLRPGFAWGANPVPPPTPGIPAPAGSCERDPTWQWICRCESVKGPEGRIIRVVCCHHGVLVREGKRQVTGKEVCC